MKHFIVLLAFLATGFTSFAQGVNLGEKPGPLPAKEFQFPKYTELFLSNGLKVFVIEDHEQPTVNIKLQIRGGEVSEKISGTASMLADMLTKGAGKRDALTIAKELDGVGAGVSSSSQGDITYVNGESIVKHLPIMLEIFSDVVKNATLPEDEFEKLRTQKLSEVKLEKSRPGSILQSMSRKVCYGLNHPSARHKSEASYKSITINDVKDFYSTYFHPNNATLTVVGDVNPDDIKKKLEAALGSWKPGDVSAFQTPKAQPMPQGVYFIARPSSVQSSTALVSSAIPYNHPDYEALRLASNLMGAGFSGRLFKTLRETYSYTYTPFAFLTSGKDINRYMCGADVRNSVTDSAITVMQAEMQKLITQTASNEELDLIKRFVVGQHKMNFENSEYLANLLLMADYNNMSINTVKEFPARFSAISAEQMKNAVAKHIAKTSIIVVGSPDVLESLRKFGPVYEYTLDFEPKKEELKKIDLTPEQLMEKHRNAVGGLENISKVNTLVTTGTASFDMNGQQMQGVFERKQKAPGKDATLTDFKVFKQKQVTDGNRAWMSMGGQTREITDPAQKNSMIKNAHILESTRLLELGSKLTIKGQEGNWIIVDVVDHAGEKATMFFDAKTFLIHKVTSMMKGPQGDIGVVQQTSNFKTVNGLVFPGKMVIEQGPVAITIDNLNYSINTPIDDSEFKLE